MARGKDERSNPNRKVGRLNIEAVSEDIGAWFAPDEGRKHMASLRSFEKNKITTKNFHDIASAIKFFGYDQTQGGKYADFIMHYDNYMKGQNK